MNTVLFFAFQTLDDIYRRDAYASIALSNTLAMLGEKEKKEVTRLVNGVIEHEYEFAWMMGRLCAKQPKAVVRVLLKMGMYLVMYTDSMPDYACVNEMANLTKQVKKEYVGFVNATLKAYCARKSETPDDLETIQSIQYNLPLWLLRIYRKQYGDKLDSRFARVEAKSHIRAGKSFSHEELLAFCKQKGLAYDETPFGVLVGATAPFSSLLSEGKATVQALDSVYIVHALLQDLPEGDLLDMCAAPGGKSVLAAQLEPMRNVVACDIHPHRVALIDAYAHRMGVQVHSEVWDGRNEREEWRDRFAGVLVDAPCSGLGVVGSNPDIVLRRTPQSLTDLAETQAALLAQAANYVRLGGVLVYSTCSDLECEDEDVVKGFLASHSQYKLETIACLPANAGEVRFACDEQGNEGFYVARMRRIG